MAEPIQCFRNQGVTNNFNDCTHRFSLKLNNTTIQYITNVSYKKGAKFKGTELGKKKYKTTVQANNLAAPKYFPYFQ